MSNIYETEHGQAKAEWLDEPQKWLVKLEPNSISDRRPLYKAITKKLHKQGWTTSILIQRKNKHGLSFTCWKDEAEKALEVIE